MKLFRFFIVFFLTFPLTSFAFEKGIEDLKARVDYARLMEDEGNYKEASKEYTRIINYYPGYEKLDYIRYKRGKSQYMAGTFKEALIDFNYIIDIEKEVEKGSVIYKNSKIFIKKILSKKNKNNKKKKHKIKRTSSEQKLKAVQIFQFHAQTLEEVDAEFQYLKREGVNTVIVRVFQNLSDRPFAFFDSDDSDEEKGVYFQTDYVPVVEDVLGDIVKIAKKNNLKVFAWMTTRYANYGLENVYDIRCRAWNVKTKDYEFCKGYDLFDGKVAKRLSGIFKDLAKYDIDGILFQDDFVLRHLEGFTEDAQYKYKKTTGRSLNPENLYIVNKETGKVTYKEEYWKWASFKNKYLMTLARHLMKEARTVNPDLKFAVNLMYETLTKIGRAHV